MTVAHVASPVVVPQCSPDVLLLPFCLLPALSPPSDLPADYCDSQVISPSTQHYFRNASCQEKNLGSRCHRDVKCQCAELMRPRVLFARHDVRARVQPIDENSAYPSRPRDGLRIVPAAQRRRDPWRHRELNPRPHIRAASTPSSIRAPRCTRDLSGFSLLVLHQF